MEFGFADADLVGEGLLAEVAEVGVAFVYLGRAGVHVEFEVFG